MANTKISNLTGAASVTDASVFPVVDSGSTKKVTGTQIKTYARTGLSTVAVSGSYNDLSNKPTIFDGNYNSLTNKPTIPSLTGYATESYVDTAVAGISVTTDYNDLTNKPIVSDTSALSGGDFFISQNESSVSLGQVAAQTIVIGGSGIQIAGTGGVTIMGVATSQVNLGGQTSGNINFNSPTTGISYNHLSDTPTIPTDINQLTDAGGLLGGGGGGSSDRLVNGSKSLVLGSDGNVDIDGHLAIKKEGLYLSTIGKTTTFGSSILNTKLFVDYNEVGITSTVDVENMPDETATATVKVGAATATMLSTDDDAGDPATQYRGQLDVSYTGITLTLANPTTVTNWVFDNNNLKLPAGGDIVDINGNSVLGEQGPAGADALWFWQGTYSDGPQYQEGDVVAYEGATYRRNGVDIGTFAAQPILTEYWEVVAERGAQGAGGQGVPTGGTTGQVLAKIDGDDFNTEWVTPTGAGASTGNITFSDTNLMSTNGDVTITFDQIASPAVGFSFTTFGEFNAPQITTGPLSTQQVDMNYTRQISNSNNISCPPNVDTVIHTGTDQYQHTFKLLLKVEGNENPGQQGWDTQSCEMMIAKSYRNDTMAGSVYGLVYTSTSPLATFTTRWNSAINRVEVLCRPTSATENVSVRSFVTEITSSD